MDFSPFIDEKSPLSPAHQVALGGNFEMGKKAGLFLSLVKSGQLLFNPADRSEGFGWSVLDFVLLTAGSDEHFEQARPLAQWLVSQGQSPWEAKPYLKPGRGPTGYELLAGHGRCAAAMAWCWELADAPPRSISPVASQVVHDEFVAHLAAGCEPMSKTAVEWLDRRNVELFEPWSNGVRPVDVLFEHARPDDKPLSRSQGASARAPHDWLAILRDIARVGSRAIKKEAPVDDVLHVRALLWANAHYASLRGNFDARPEWVGTLIQFDKILAKSQRWSETGLELHTKAHHATIDWLLSQSSFPMTRMAMEVALGEVGEFTAQVLGNPSPFRQVEALLHVSSRAWPQVEQVPLGVDPPGTTDWGWDPWRRAWRHLEKTLERFDFDDRRPVWEDPRIWFLALPCLALSKPSPTSKPTGADILEMALERGNLWPDRDSCHEIMESRAWSEPLRSQVVARRMTSNLPSASHSSLRPRL